MKPTKNKKVKKIKTKAYAYLSPFGELSRWAMFSEDFQAFKIATKNTDEPRKGWKLVPVEITYSIPLTTKK